VDATTFQVHYGSLALREISKSFPGVKAVDKVSIDFHPGEIHALMGENGAGKSTLLKIITGIYQPGSTNCFKLSCPKKQR
jgi:ABC-type sugar transport system ATPase subunit